MKDCVEDENDNVEDNGSNDTVPAGMKTDTDHPMLTSTDTGHLAPVLPVPYHH